MGSRLAAILVFFFISNVVFAQTPIVRQYIAKEYKANSVNWGGVQAPNGRLFFSNTDGVLIFDGRRWRLLSVPGRGARGIGLHEHFVFFGTHNSIGVLDSDDPNFEPIWLNDRIPKDVEVKTVFTVQFLGSSVFFETQSYIFEFDVQSFEFIAAHRSPQYITATYIVNDRLLIIGEDLIYELKDNSFVPVRSAYINDEFVLTLIQHPIEGVLFGMNSNRIYHTKNGLNEKPLLWGPKEGQAPPDFELYLGALSNQRFASDKLFFPTLSHGIAEFDSDGNLLKVYDQTTGVTSNNVYGGFFDNEGNIWSLGQNGISHIQYSQRLQIIANKAWNDSPIHSTSLNNETYYIGTNDGLYMSKTNSLYGDFTTVLKSQIWQIGENSDKNIVVAGGNSGFYVVNGNQVIQNLKAPVSTRSFLISSKNPNILYIGLYNGARKTEKKGTKYAAPKTIRGISGDVRTIVEDTSGNIWFGTTASGLFRMSIQGNDTTIAHFDANRGLCTDEHNMVYLFSEQLYATCRTGLHKFDQKNQRFTTFNWGLKKPSPYPRFTSLSDGRIVSLTDKTILKSDFSVSDSLSLQSVEGIIMDVEIFGENLLLSSESGLYQMQTTRSESTTSLPEPIVELWYNWKDAEKYFNLLHKEIILPNKLSEFTIRFSLPSYVQQQNFQYRYKLDGLHESWRPYGSYTELTYSDLSPGIYTFNVQAINDQGSETLVYSGKIVITPKWYQTWWAYTLLGIVVLGIVYLIFWINNYRLIRQNEYLVGLVDSRTDEIRQQNIQLSHQAEEIHRINEMRGRLTRVAVHDLRNPLHILQGYLDLLTEDDSEPDKIRARMQEVTHRMLQKINDLLDIDQRGFSKNAVSLQIVNVTDVVVEVLQNNSILARKKHQSIESEILADISMKGNPNKLNEIFDNVVNNAIKYSPTNSTITVHLSKITDGVIPRLLFKVTDQGLGISEGYRDKIFQPYTTGESKPTGGEYSTGLGLSIVKQYVQELNGNISCMNREGRGGTIFIITIPLES